MEDKAEKLWQLAIAYHRMAKKDRVGETIMLGQIQDISAEWKEQANIAAYATDAGPWRNLK